MLVLRSFMCFVPQGSDIVYIPHVIDNSTSESLRDCPRQPDLGSVPGATHLASYRPFCHHSQNIGIRVWSRDLALPSSPII